SELTARNNASLSTLVNKHGVILKKFPDKVLKEIKKTSDQVVAEVAKKDAATQKVYNSYIKFRDEAMAWHDVSERAYLNARAL
ncbi:MAG: ABC transporter substrate-binding protein, partial [Gammaproteobacteria bacterium]|nr:ABC transporter substrate-binding protein [Gammaproteobacteria bacterium]